jgi:methylenetetrahydrofolate dehydrogenase (NADP+)/methenyltetrahydrofolate cyclohydrolase
MSARVLEGAPLAETLRNEASAESARFREEAGRPPGLRVILVGEDPGSTVYVRSKERAAVAAGLRAETVRLPAGISEPELLLHVEEANRDTEIDGLLVQMPLPPGIDFRKILDAVDPAKDVDGFHPVNTGLLVQKRPKLRPCTSYGVIRLAQEYGIALRGLRATVVGASNIVGRPMALELLLAGATVTVCHTGTRDLKSEVERAELVVSAVGKPGFIPGAWIRPGAAVFDVGINHSPSGKLVGDVEYEPAAQRAGWITPVPGGLGPMTIAMLLSNAVDAAFMRAGGKD